MKTKNLFAAASILLVLFLCAGAHAEDLGYGEGAGGDYDYLDEAPVDVNEDDMLDDSEMGIISGTITGINTGAGTITVKSDEGDTKMFAVDTELSMLWKGENAVGLEGLAAGDVVDVSYITDEGGSLAVEWLEVIPAGMGLPAGPGMEEESIIDFGTEDIAQ